jgi:hypothetical protein
MSSYPYRCQVDVSFPKPQQAEYAMKVLQVDREPGDRVVKSFSLVAPVGADEDKVTTSADETVVMRV